MTIARAEGQSDDALRIVEKYEGFVAYLYPILLRADRRHGVLRDAVLAQLFTPIGGLYHAARSRQVSRLHAVDAEFATLRSHLRFLARDAVKVITPKQHKTALALLSEPGRMLGAWQRKLNESRARPASAEREPGPGSRPGRLGQTGE